MQRSRYKFNCEGEKSISLFPQGCSGVEPGWEVSAPAAPSPELVAWGPVDTYRFPGLTSASAPPPPPPPTPATGGGGAENPAARGGPNSHGARS